MSPGWMSPGPAGTSRSPGRRSRAARVSRCAAAISLSVSPDLHGDRRDRRPQEGVRSGDDIAEERLAARLGTGTGRPVDAVEVAVAVDRGAVHRQPRRLGHRGDPGGAELPLGLRDRVGRAVADALELEPVRLVGVVALRPQGEHLGDAGVRGVRARDVAVRPGGVLRGVDRLDRPAVAGDVVVGGRTIRARPVRVVPLVARRLVPVGVRGGPAVAGDVDAGEDRRLDAPPAPRVG